jgi:sterol desaturase/sphingolipid hydroxylase (fatty acid hydroxylase superfamily)
MRDFLTYAGTQLTKAFTAFAQPESYLYWPYLVSALVIAVVFGCAARARQGAPSSSPNFPKGKFNFRLWWHPSARADYQLYFANALILPTLFAFVSVSDAQVVKALSQAFGAAQPAQQAGIESASIAVRFAFTVTFFIAYDLGRFIAHSLLHDIPLLWEFHKVHHSAETLNPFTTFRAHPVELLVMIWIPVLMTGTVTWLFNHIAATPVTFYTYLGVHIILFASNLIGTLRHTHVWLSYGPVLNKWLISPAQHQLHHSREPRHRGCNRGFELAIWDRLYGTLYLPASRESFSVGLGDGTDGQWHTLTRIYLQPFVNAMRRVHADVRQQPMESGDLFNSSVDGFAMRSESPRPGDRSATSSGQSYSERGRLIE